LDDLGVGGRIILKYYIIKIGWEGVDLIGLTQDRDKWWAVVNRVMNIRVLYSAGNFLTS
jgi:hypothetical protein